MKNIIATRVDRYAFIFLLAAFLLANVSTLKAQANNGTGDTQNVMAVDFYRVPPGHQDEWLALYKKWHYPIMQYQLAHGYVLSEKLYTRATHELEPSWDFAIVIVSPPSGKGPKVELTRGALIRKLFPNLDEYVEGEKQRWSMTTAHWDERWTEVDVATNPSLYYPAP
jgi:hypothetical protein